MTPNNYMIKPNTTAEDFVNAGFSIHKDCYIARHCLYGDDSIVLNLMVNREDFFIAISVTDSATGLTYAPFYNPSVRHNNKVADKVIKEYNKVMGKYVKRGIMEKVNCSNPDTDLHIKVKYFNKELEQLTYVDGKSDWIDLRCAKDVSLKKGEYCLIPLGIAMQLPEGYEAHVVPRSSTYKNFGIIQTNHMGVIDETYCGDNDQWHMPVIAMRDTDIHVNDRICQFRIMEHQPRLVFDTAGKLDNKDRGGIGSTGKR